MGGRSTLPLLEPMIRAPQSRHFGAAAVFLPALLVLLLQPQVSLALSPSKVITQYIQSTWNSETGLPQNSIHAMAQTRDGYLWFGTEEGLARFDGAQFAVFTHHNSGLASDYIQSLLADRDGGIWIGTDSGLSHLRFIADFGSSGPRFFQGAAFSTLTVKDGLSDNSIRALAEDSEGTLWVATSRGVDRVRNDRVEAVPEPARLSSAAVNAIALDRRGAVWVASEAGAFRFENRGFAPVSIGEDLEKTELAALAPAADGSIWVGTLGHGIRRIRDGRVVEAPKLPWQEIDALLVDRDGALWISFDRNGIGRLYEGKLSLYRDANGLPSNRCTHALFEDREGDIWIGLLDAGVAQLRDGKFTPFGKPEGLAGDYIGNLLQAPDGSMWIGSDSNGLNHVWPDGRVEIWDHRNGLPDEAIYSLLETRDGSLWVGYRRGSLAQIRNGKVTVYHDVKSKVSINALFEDREGSLWVGFYDRGLARFEGGIFHHVTETGRIPAIQQTPDGALWIGLDGDGVERRLDGSVTRFTTANGLPSDHVMSLFVDSRGAVWVGTASGGLSRIRDGHITTWTPDQGLTDPTIGSIIEDNAGDLWIGGDSGIAHLARKELDEPASGSPRTLHPVLYGTVDGLRSRETLYGCMPSAWKDHEGRLWFGTIMGAAMIDPANIRVNTAVPPVWIENIAFDSRPVRLAGGMRLGPGAGNLEISFSAPSFAAPQNVRFRYRLVGFDSDWIQAGSRRRAWYTNLPPGHYTFTVQAENSDGVWNLQGASFSFVLQPPLARTPLAYVSYCIAVLLLTWGVITLRTRNLIRRQQELTRTVAERTAELEAEKNALEEARRELHLRATHDTLTGLLNRAAILEHLEHEVSRAGRDRLPIGVLIADLDHFKRVNDVYGHLCGDDVIRETARRFRDVLRDYDLAGRYGGEEFLILLPGMDPSQSPERVEALLDAIRSTPFESSGQLVPVTCSIGVATFHPDFDSPDIREMLTRADTALYVAKNLGRDQASFEARVSTTR